jgi:hypothetical protein
VTRAEADNGSMRILPDNYGMYNYCKQLVKDGLPKKKGREAVLAMLDVSIQQLQAIEKCHVYQMHSLIETVLKYWIVERMGSVVRESDDFYRVYAALKDLAHEAETYQEMENHDVTEHDDLFSLVDRALALDLFEAEHGVMEMLNDDND